MKKHLKYLALFIASLSAVIISSVAQQVTENQKPTPKAFYTLGGTIQSIDADTQVVYLNGGRPGRTRNKVLNTILPKKVFGVLITSKTELGKKEMNLVPAAQLKADDRVWYLKKKEELQIFMRRTTVASLNPLTLEVRGDLVLVKQDTRRYYSHLPSPFLKGIGTLSPPDSTGVQVLVVTKPSEVEFKRTPPLKFSDFTAGQKVTVRMIIHPNGKLEADEFHLD